MVYNGYHKSFFNCFFVDNINNFIFLLQYFGRARYVVFFKRFSFLFYFSVIFDHFKKQLFRIRELVTEDYMYLCIYFKMYVYCFKNFEGKNVVIWTCMYRIIIIMLSFIYVQWSNQQNLVVIFGNVKVLDLILVYAKLTVFSMVTMMDTVLENLHGVFVIIDNDRLSS